MYKVGQKLYVNYNRRAPAWAIITKVGTKWLELDGGKDRASVETLALDGRGYAPPGRCYESLDAWKREKELGIAWRSLRAAIDRAYVAPSGVTAEVIAQVAEMLGFQTPSK